MPVQTEPDVSLQWGTRDTGATRALPAISVDLIPEPTRTSQIATRCFDLVVSVPALVLLAPVMLVIGLVVMVSSPGPVIYGSPRLGSPKRGSAAPTFRAWKFRSMHVDAESRLERLLRADPLAWAEYETYRKLHNDPRVTPVGSFLRKTSLDELPQLVNVIKGEMSIVGPRPKLLNEQELFGASLMTVLRVKPGLTGLWQISGRNKLTVEQRIQLDVKYALERSFAQDVRICVLTLIQLLQPGKNGAV